MPRLRKILDEIIALWLAWDNLANEKYYLDTLSLQLVENPSTGNESERRLFSRLKSEFPDIDGLLLGTYLRMRRSEILNDQTSDQLTLAEAEHESKSEAAANARLAERTQRDNSRQVERQNKQKEERRQELLNAASSRQQRLLEQRAIAQAPATTHLRPNENRQKLSALVKESTDPLQLASAKLHAELENISQPIPNTLGYLWNDIFLGSFTSEELIQVIRKTEYRDDVSFSDSLLTTAANQGAFGLAKVLLNGAPSRNVEKLVPQLTLLDPTNTANGSSVAAEREYARLVFEMSISQMVGDYEVGDQITPRGVDRWVNQFKPDVQLIMLSEIDHILRASYVSRNKMEHFIKDVANLKFVSGNPEPAEFWQSAKLLDSYQAGGSQATLNGMLRAEVREQFRIEIGENPEAGSSYIYIDDCIYSGVTVLRDIQDWYAGHEPPPGSTVTIVARSCYSESRWWEDQLRQNVPVQFDIKRMYSILNGPPTRQDVIWPDATTYGEFASEISAFTLNDSRAFAPRQNSAKPAGKIFRSENGRQLLEGALLKTGFELSQSTHFGNGRIINPKLRFPLGFSSGNFGLGFGAMNITYRNCPNTVPLAMWCDIDGWFPLFKRRYNQADYGNRESLKATVRARIAEKNTEDVEELPW